MNKNLKKILLLIVFTISMLLLVAFVMKKDYICHENNGTKQYSLAPVNFNSYKLHGHDGHDGDIIPPFDYVKNGVSGYYPGKNWTVENQAIWANGCRAVIPDPTNTSVPVSTNTSVPIPTNTPVPVPTGNPTNTPVPVLTNTPVPVITNTPVSNNTKIPPPIRYTPTCIPCKYVDPPPDLDTPTIVMQLTPFIEEGLNVCVVGAVKGADDYTCFSEAYVIRITDYDLLLDGIESILQEDGTYVTAFYEWDYQNNNAFSDCEVRFTGDLDGVMQGLGYLEPGDSMVYDEWYPRMEPFVK